MAPILGIMASQISGHLFAPSGAYDSIATTTLSTATGTVSFTSIPATYTHLQMRISVIAATAGQTFQAFVNNDTGTTYATHVVYGNGTATGAAGVPNSTGYSPVYGRNVGSTTAPCVVIMDILDYANTSKYKTMRSLSGSESNSNGEIDLSSSVWMNTTAINRLDFNWTSGNCAQYSSFALYGIKGA
jgi:hypothetical protein